MFLGTAGINLVSRALSAVLGIFYARYLGPAEFGMYSYAMAIISMATVPAVAGIPNLVVREISRLHFSKEWALLAGVIKWSRAYVLLLSVVIALLMGLSLQLLNFEDPVTGLLFLAIVLIPLRGGIAQQSAVLSGFNQPVLAQLPPQIFAPVVTLVALSFLVISGEHLTGIKLVFIMIFASCVSITAGRLILKKVVGVSLNKHKAEYSIRVWQSSLLPFSIMAFVTASNNELASVLLGWLSGSEPVGYFKVAIQAMTLVTLGLTSVNAVIMPRVARLYKKGDIESTQKLLTRSVRLSAVVSLPAILLLVVFGESLISFLFGPEYLDAYPLLVVLCAGQVVNVLAGSVGLVLNMTGNEKRALRSLFIALIVQLLLLMILIPVHGSLGAAIAMSVGLIFWNLLMAIDVKRITGLRTWVT